MPKQTVFLVGATGETGRTLLDALVEDGSFDITCFVRAASAGKPATQALRDRGLKVVTGDLSGPVEDTAALLKGVDTVVCSISAVDIPGQAPLVAAAARAGVRRFVPCNWGTVSPRGGVMELRDEKEEVHDDILRRRLGYTIIDVGYWYEISFPRVPSGRLDAAAAALPLRNELVAGGAAPNMLTAKRDVGRVTAEIIKDPRTLNKRVFAYGEVLSQNEVNAIIERKTGEKPEFTHVSADQVRANVKAAREELEANPADVTKKLRLTVAQYGYTKYVRGDNTPENAEYLGYVSGNALYPDFEFARFADFVDELLAGKVRRPYADLVM